MTLYAVGYLIALVLAVISAFVPTGKYVLAAAVAILALLALVEGTVR